MLLEHTARTDAPLGRILRGEMGLSSGLIGRLKYRSSLLVNGQPQHTNYPVHPGDRIGVQLLEPEPNYPAESGPLHILYEDSALIAVDKPPGMLVHPSRARNTGTLANRLLGHYRASGQDSAVHPVTRLDRDTFGVVLLAKNSHVHALLCQQQLAGGFQKTYHALVLGAPQAQEIALPILRPDPMSMLRCTGPGGKEARTLLSPLETGEAYSLVRLTPVTGRTHQLRVHTAAIGHPILGDPQYGRAQTQALSQTLGLTFQQLCAHSLQLRHPLTGETLEFTSGFCLGLEKFVAPGQNPVYNGAIDTTESVPQSTLEDMTHGYV